MQIIMKMLTGKEITLEVEGSNTVWDIKRQLHKKDDGSIPEKTVFIFGGRELQAGAMYRHHLNL